MKVGWWKHNANANASKHVDFNQGMLALDNYNMQIGIMFTWLCGLYVYIVRSFCKSQDITRTSPSSAERCELDKFRCMTTRYKPCLSWVSMTKACCWSNWNGVTQKCLSCQRNRQQILGTWICTILRTFRFNHVQPIERIHFFNSYQPMIA